MPILIVPSHHHSPKNLENMDEYIGPYGKGISVISPEKVIYEMREGDRRL